MLALITVRHYHVSPVAPSIEENFELQLFHYFSKYLLSIYVPGIGYTLVNKAVKVFIFIELSMIGETDNKQVKKKINVTLQIVI